MTSPLVSIVLPSYNGERFLKKQLDSIFAQSFQDFEVIVADDVSTDSTVEILKSYTARDNFHYSVNPQNLGFIQNFCSAMKKAKGRYIAPCDQDDVWLPDKLQSLLAEVDDHLLVYSNSELVDENEISLGKDLKQSLKINFISGNNHRAFYYGNCVAAHTMLFRRELLAHIDTLPETVYHDHWLAFIASRLGSIHAVDKKLVLYRRHDSSVTTTVVGKKIPKSPLAHLMAKANRQSERNQRKLQKLKTFQAFNRKINQPDEELDEIIRQLEKFDQTLFNRKIFSILRKRHDEYFAITRKKHLSLVLEESEGRKFYQYFPIT